MSNDQSMGRWNPAKVAEVLALYDAEMRTRPPTEEGTRVERAGPVVRLVGRHNFIIFSDLGNSDAAAVIAQETAYLQSLGKEAEWKVYGHDRPTELGQLLQSAGYVPDPPETLVVYDLVHPMPESPKPEGLDIRQIVDDAGLRAAVRVSKSAFGTDGGWQATDYSDRLSDPSLALFIAYWDGTPVASARLEMPPGRSFAGLWGGGTAPQFRRRGIYRGLVSVRAEMARARGYRFLSVDARESSRPILEHIGFEPIDTMVGWILKR